MTNKVNFQEIFDAVQMDPEAKQVFLTMPREEQLLAILGMQAWTRSELAVVKKDLIKVRDDFEDFKDDVGDYRIKRERREQKERGSNGIEESEDISEKIGDAVAKALAGRFDFWIWFRDKVLPTVVTIAFLAMLYFIFGGKVPTP